MNNGNNVNYHSLSSSDSSSGLIPRDSQQQLPYSPYTTPANARVPPVFSRVDSGNGSNSVAISINNASNVNRTNPSSIGATGIGFNNSNAINVNSGSRNNLSNSNSVPLLDLDMTNVHLAIQGIFNDTKCYDLMQTSSKGTVFETTIPFQLAFFALVEHDTDVAPLWDPERRQFVGLMTVGDYIHALRVWRSQRLPTAELTNRSINDMIQLSNSMVSQQQSQQQLRHPHLPSVQLPLIVRFRHADFQAVEAEDSVVQLSVLLLRSGNDYVPVLDPDTGSLVSILGYLDIVHLLDQAAIQYPQFFGQTLQQLRIGAYSNLITAPRHAKVCDILDALDAHGISSLPIVDEAGRVVDTYHRSDVSFVIKAADPDEVIANLGALRVDECIRLREQLLQSGEVMSASQGLVLCRPEFPLSQIVRAMMTTRSTKAVVVDEAQQCIGIVSIKDIIKHYLSR